MKIHEYQAKKLFRQYNIPVPQGRAAFNPAEARAAAEEIGGGPVVVKAQIHAGGRGKGGGVRLAESPEEAERVASEIIGLNLVTHQTGPEGRLVQKVLVEEALDIAQELYLSVLPDRKARQWVIVASTAGGMDIEETARDHPDRIVKTWVDPLLGVMPYHLRRVCFSLGLTDPASKSVAALVKALYILAVQNDCSLVEVNPLVITGDERALALDAKVNLDDNGLYRHRDLADFRDPDEEDPLEVEASKYNLNYIKMGGNIGNMVNGAGLAMATMDLIKRAGAEPANFLDVGGGASEEMVENGLRIILGDQQVKAVLINIFGGILRCDVLANGVVKAARKIGIEVPVVVRMEGTNVEEGRRILAESGLDLITARDLGDAAGKIAAIAAG